MVRDGMRMFPCNAAPRSSLLHAHKHSLHFSCTATSPLMGTLTHIARMRGSVTGPRAHTQKKEYKLHENRSCGFSSFSGAQNMTASGTQTTRAWSEQIKCSELCQMDWPKITTKVARKTVLAGTWRNSCGKDMKTLGLACSHRKRHSLWSYPSAGWSSFSFFRHILEAKATSVPAPMI